MYINFECHSSTIGYEVYRTSTVEEKFTANKREYAHCFNATARCDGAITLLVSSFLLLSEQPTQIS
ncbi:hypothetical protein [Scytonema sp. HK-05]|uniref:hypothetical protein n=1 Tax=Scytonema sp. HK-05 TaxID=1137095 RepID=UPI0011611A91|nr:hypothetical protein [Scytonema sp. HK-05]